VNLEELQEVVAQGNIMYAVKGQHNFELSKAVVGNLDSIQHYIIV
jgi:hypothetical protein